MTDLINRDIEIEGEPFTVSQDRMLNNYISIRWTCEWIGLSVGQRRSELRRVGKDPLLSRGCNFFSIMTNGGIQRSLFLNVNYLPIWLSSLNRKVLNADQYGKLIRLINFTMSVNFDELKQQGSYYESERLLEDEIDSYGELFNIKIVGRQLSYNFGRVDLLGKDENDKLVVFELKRNTERDVIEQCVMYKNGFKNEFGEDVRIIIIQSDCSEIIDKANEYGFECYEYIRKLKFKRIS